LKTTGLRELDFSDDRLCMVLNYLGQNDGPWAAYESEQNTTTMRVYNIKARRIRIDSSTAQAFGAGRGMLPRPKRLKTSGTLRWSLNVATGYIPRRAFGNTGEPGLAFTSGLVVVEFTGSYATTFSLHGMQVNGCDLLNH
jgi:hypothetical protein